MRLPSFQYLEPTQVDEAVSILADFGDRVKICAGGTEVINHLRRRLIRPAAVMNIRKLPDLEGLSETTQEIVIGANTTLKEISRSKLINREAQAVAEAAGQTASPTIIAMATIGGNILQNTRCLNYNQSGIVLQGLPVCHKRGGADCLAVPGSRRCFSVYQGDLAPALMALRAQCVLVKKGAARTVPLTGLFTGDGTKPLALEEDELLTRIVIPKTEGRQASAYRKFRVRGSVDFPLASAAAFLSVTADFLLADSCVVIGASGPAPRVVESAEALLKGKTPGAADAAIVAKKAFDLSEGVDNLTLPGDYRRKMVRVLTQRAVQAALENLKGGR
ncbi:MAG: FAD binding domain-containing protein [Deltaproteobacteria bacterium]|nr:FAD binding domain-containing protein [Deltaproteobacteria bacterium]